MILEQDTHETTRNIFVQTLNKVQVIQVNILLQLTTRSCILYTRHKYIFFPKFKADLRHIMGSDGAIDN